jgi:outer membrane protein
VKKSLFLAAGVAALVACSAAYAQDYTPSKAGTWIVDLRGTGVLPSNEDAIKTAAGVDTGLKTRISDSYVPTLGITYFITDHISSELILGTSYHKINAVGPGVNAEVRDTWVLPPVLTVQYRPAPASRLNPYVGAGINYMWFYTGSGKNGYSVHLPNGFGWALQAGADVALKGPWTLNVDVKKVFFETDAKVNGGALTAHAHLDPWVPSIGIGRKF